MLIWAPVSRHCTHRRRKLKKMTIRITTMTQTMSPATTMTVFQGFCSARPGKLSAAASRRSMEGSLPRQRPATRAATQRRWEVLYCNRCEALAEINVLEVRQPPRLHRPDDHLARLDVNAADHLAGVDHHAFGDAVDPPPVEVHHAGRPQR